MKNNIYIYLYSKKQTKFVKKKQQQQTKLKGKRRKPDK